MALGWKERTPWKEGLKWTIDWYLSTGGDAAYWDNGDMAEALSAHPASILTPKRQGGGKWR